MTTLHTGYQESFEGVIYNTTDSHIKFYIRPNTTLHSGPRIPHEVVLVTGPNVRSWRQLNPEGHDVEAFRPALLEAHYRVLP